MDISNKKTIILLRFGRPLLHILLIVGSFRLMGMVRGFTDLIPFVQLRIPAIDTVELLIFASVAAVIFVFIGMIFGLYQLWRPIHGYYRKFIKTWRVWILVISFVAYMGFGYLFVGGISRFVLIVGSLVGFVVMTIVDIFYNKINRKLEDKNPYKALIIGNTDGLTEDLLESLGNYKMYDLTLIDEEEYDQSLLEQYDIVITVGSYDSELLQVVADDTRIAGTLFYHASDSFFLEDLIAVPHRIGPVMAMEYRPSPLDGWWRVVKRAFDFFVSLFAIIILSPLLLLIALIIKLDSKGPALYKQKRVGKNNKPFTFIKFRSMYTHLSVGEEYGGEDAWKFKEKLMKSDKNVRKGELQKIEDDPRVTSVGRFLRKTSLDELPNLFSVLQGTMSLVGPRPHEPFEVARYKPWQKRLLSVKPGITGYAQIFGRDSLSFDEEAKLDLYYIQNWSVQMDVYVLISTLRVVMRGS